MSGKFRKFLGFLLLFAVCFGLGAIFKDYYIGPLTLAFGSLSAYYMSVGKWQNYIYAILFNVLYSYTCILSGLFGYAIFATAIYLPTNIWGLVSWLRNKSGESVRMKSMSFRSAAVLVSLVIFVSVLVGYLLTLIPSQNLAFLDSTSQAINLSGVVILALRYREGWYVFLANNTVDLVIWIINTIERTASAEMMLIVSVMYLVMNFYGLVQWFKIERRQKGAL